MNPLGATNPPRDVQNSQFYTTWIPMRQNVHLRGSRDLRVYHRRARRSPVVRIQLV